MRAFVCNSCGLKLYRGGRAERACPICHTTMEPQASARSTLLPIAQRPRGERELIELREARQGT